MIGPLTDLFIVFGWLCFLTLGTCVLCWLDNCNYWMPPLYVGWGIAVFVVTAIATIIS